MTSNTVQVLVDSLGKADVSRKRDRNDPMERYTHAARWLPASFDTFVNLTAVLDAGMKMNQGSIADLENTDTDDRDYFQRVYEAFSKSVPGLAEVVLSLHQNPGARKKFIAKVVTAAGDARADDTASLRNAGVAYICKDPGSQVSPPITKDQGKSVRGFNHPTTARLLCPMRCLTDFDRDPKSMTNRIKDGSVKITSVEWPSFLYDETMYDPKEKDKGFLRGFLLVRVYRHLFTGPASALSPNDRKSTKPPKAKIHRLTNVTPRTIAYAAVQARFMISSSSTWSVLDGTFNAKRVFYDIVKLFETDPGDAWCVETLKWWDQQVPGLQQDACKTRVIKDLTVEENNDLEDILAARLKRRYGTGQAPPPVENSTDSAALPPVSTENHNNEPQHSSSKKQQTDLSTGNHKPVISDSRGELDSCSSLSSENEYEDPSKDPSKSVEENTSVKVLKSKKKTTTKGKTVKPKRKARK